MTAVPDTWVIGDLQGCCTPLDTLTNHPDIASAPRTRLWFAGDLVNRGPDSLGALRRVMALGERAVSVLGNHDLHLLAVAAGASALKKGDTLRDILDAPDAQSLIDWIRHRPLAHYEQGHLLVHAGVHKTWDTRKTLALAQEVETALRGPHWKATLGQMYGNQPDNWSDDLRGSDRLRAIINIMTRMRMCHQDGRLDFAHKGEPMNNGRIMPWFDLPDRAMRHDTVIFGHWSALGLMLRPDAICLDTGCIWGRQLTALRLRDRALIQVPCAQQRKPKGQPQKSD
ncbi:symmetrical bis(5'-nucleosyl)-tetraphosphatase [Allopusillimonas ginsengisoli]|uniref:symmetrical bis(5'-nucleosyl)-tetraphosphatase n=1 Tax=Allopusillimonas ginsengisoli TaxID=453575 RepID=UPI00101F5D5E|nr:symmetrical bis(5'-nucleosyl)-tetraphosphatase [Allopusillimonas ginsengisoli]TEA79098.1 symmetrical bis(5'-nucleosyl)-tetraphosphatase [Allopusillimonas ginsengisoli]